MANLEWLFGAMKRSREHVGTAEAARRKPSQGATATGPDAALEIQDIGSRMLAIPALDFFGLYECSANGRFRLAWRDGDGNRGGTRERGDGYYVLIDRDRVVARGRMERPNDGKVADNGNFILNDWGFTTELSGTFKAFRADGAPILTQSFAANLFNNGLSTDGALAACHTCNSSSEADSAVLTVFDLARGVELSRFRAESGWPHTYGFDPDLQNIRLGYANEGGEFDYSLDGGFIDREKWISARLKQGDLYMVRRLFDEAGGQPEPALAGRLMAAVESGLAQPTWRDERSQAFGWRLRGELLDSAGSKAEAIACYERAVSLNPKIGIKRRLDLLKKSQPAQ